MNKPVQNVNFPQLEDEVIKFWKENQVFEKSVDQRPLSNQYRFLDGPPFPSGTPHYGHLLMSIAKDVVPRYQTMKGKRVRRVFGWDCHGIAVESKVNIELGISTRKQIEEYGIEKYVKECRKYVEGCIANWGWYIEKVGRWVDMENAYYTMYPEYHESVLWAFKQIWDKGYVYKGKRVSLYSVETCTPVSDFEVAEGDDYREIEDLSVFLNFKLVGIESNKELSPYKGVSIIAWTTTPWTLPSNFGLAVNPDAEYDLVKYEDNYYILASKLLTNAFEVKADEIGTDSGFKVQIIKSFRGTDLEGIKYEPLYDYFLSQTNENDYKIYLYDGVTIEDGTGVLHIAPAFGEEDFNLGKKFGISDFRDIDEEGKMTVGVATGVYIRKASEIITEELRANKKLFRSQLYLHKLPFYRGSEPLIYMAQDSYFIDIQKIKPRLLELNEKINWIPDSVKKVRFPDIIKSAPDWCISRNRYWATIMPLWKSEDGEELVIGSFEEMANYTDQIERKEINGKTEYYTNGEKLSAHRDRCDQLVLKKDGKEFRRVTEVLDVWLDSSSAPFAELHYPFENKEIFEAGFPTDFVVEGAGMVRAWFNVLHRTSALIFDDIAFKNVICAGTFAGSDGRKMSKTYGNYTDPKEVLEKLGGETLRLFLVSSAVMSGGEANWSDDLLREQQKNVLIPLWNVYKYFLIYAELFKWTPKSTVIDSENIMDKWIKEYIQDVVNKVTGFMEAYDLAASIKMIQPAVDTISTWYIRRSRDRFVNGDKEALQTLYSVLVTLIKVFAPHIPFVTENMYQNLVVKGLSEKNGAKLSVHLEDYPTVSQVDDSILEKMKNTRDLASEALAIRELKSLKLRQPLSTLYLPIQTQQLVFEEILKDEVNVNKIEYYEPTKPPKGENLVESSGKKLILDLEITSELKLEGLYNDLTRVLQVSRKETGCKVGELAVFSVFTESQEIKALLTTRVDTILADYKVKVIIADLKNDDAKEYKLNEDKLYVVKE